MLRIAKRTLQVIAGAGAIGAIAAGAAAATQPGAYTTKGAWSFVSAPKLHPPKLFVDKPIRSKQLAPGYFMITNFKNLGSTSPMTGEGGPMIYDKSLQPVWSYPIGTSSFANNLRVQSYKGKPALSWWQGIVTNTGATQSGAVHLVDQHYRPIGKPLSGADGWTITQHEALVTGHDMWVTAVKDVPASQLNGPAGVTVIDSAVQKYDLTNGQLLYTWDVGQHVPLSDSYQPVPPSPAIPWDAYHINSIQLGPNRFITSLRNTWAAYNVDTKSGGAISWILGGRHSTFTLPAKAVFHWQHDVELHPDGLVSVFDDACCEVTGPDKFAPPSGPSRSLLLKLKMSNHTGSFVAQYTRGRTFDVGFQGNTQLLPGGNVLTGWGSRPYFTEYNKAGKIVFEAVLPDPDLTYRAYLSKWVGTPYYPPTGAARNRHGKATVYASWNGATQVTGWRVLAGSSAKRLKPVAQVSKVGFETAIRLGAEYNSFKIQALGAKGRVLRTSKAFSVPKPGTKPSPPSFY